MAAILRTEALFAYSQKVKHESQANQKHCIFPIEDFLEEAKNNPIETPVACKFGAGRPRRKPNRSRGSNAAWVR